MLTGRLPVRHGVMGALPDGFPGLAEGEVDVQIGLVWRVLVGIVIGPDQEESAVSDDDAPVSEQA